MTTLLQDIRYAIRQLAKNPSFTAVALLTLALGIGANTAVFSVVNAVLLQPLTYPQAERIVTLSTTSKQSGGLGLISGPDFHDWHDQSTAFEAMAYYEAGVEAVSVRNAADYAHIALVSPEFFRVFGMQPSAGRLFVSEEERASTGAAIISYDYWQAHFGKSTEALHQPAYWGGKPYNIVGIMPAGFNFPSRTDVWLPSATVPENNERSSHNYMAIGRLKPDVSLQQAQTQIAAIAGRLEQAYPLSNKDMAASVTRLHDSMVADVRLTLYLLLGAVGMVLLIACANIASLTLAKATSRRRELAVRAALGASSIRLMRQLVTESMLLASFAGLVGLLLAKWGSKILVLLAPEGIPRLAESRIDVEVLAFTAGISILGSFLFGLAPAVQVAELDLNKALNQGAIRGIHGGMAGRLRTILVVAEVALSVVLLAGAGVLLKSFVALHNVTLGFRAEHVLVMGTSFPASRRQTMKEQMWFYKTVLTELNALPGVSAGAVRTLPGHVDSYGSYWIDHLPKERGISGPQTTFSVVAPGTFHALNIPIRRGRDFSDADAADSPFTVVVNESFARHAFPSEDPIGHVIYCGFDSDDPMRIVGIAGDVRQYGPASNPQPEIYMPYVQHPRPSGSLNILARTTGDPVAFTADMQRMAHQLIPDLPLKFTTLETSLSEHFVLPRFRTWLIGIFAGLAVCLAMVGIYGIMAYVVSQRRSEIGLRIAIGVHVLLSLSPGNIPRIGEDGAGVGLDWRVLGFTALVSVFTGVVFGLIPAFAISRADVTSTLKENSGRSGTSFRQNKTRSILVVTEMALALVLLIGAGLLIRTFIALRGVDPGFDSNNVLTMHMSLSGARFEKTSGVAQLNRAGVERLRAIPGVEEAASTCCVPLEGGFGLPFSVVGRSASDSNSKGDGGWLSLSPDYFKVFKVPLMRGRFFSDQDDGGREGVVIINQTMARRFWPKSDPLNDHILIGQGVGPAFDEPARQIVGVVGDVRSGLDQIEAGPMMYIPSAQVTDGMRALNASVLPIAWVVRTKVAPDSLRTAVANALRDASGGLPVADMRSMDEVIVRSTARANFNMLLLTIFACSALLLAAIGIYGLMAYAVQQRTQEIGIRMALGAQKSAVRNMVVFQGMKLALIGVAIGLAAAFGLVRLLASFLFKVKTWDPVSFTLVPLLLAAVAFLAVWLPAQRTTRIDPVDALRYE